MPSYRAWSQRPLVRCHRRASHRYALSSVAQAPLLRLAMAMPTQACMWWGQSEQQPHQ